MLGQAFMNFSKGIQDNVGSLFTYTISSDGPYSMLSWSLFANLIVKPVIYKWHKMH